MFLKYRVKTIEQLILPVLQDLAGIKKLHDYRVGSNSTRVPAFAITELIIPRRAHLILYEKNRAEDYSAVVSALCWGS